MIYLLDTHILLWSLFEPQKLAPQIRSILDDEQPVKYVSGINLWEISLKYGLGKLELGSLTPEQLSDSLPTIGYKVLDVDSRLLATSHRLPRKENHRDPFDRFLIWQAVSAGYTLLTQDSRVEQYTSDGLSVVFARA